MALRPTVSLQFARLNQVNIITPFAMAGAMAPATVAGALVQQNAEVLATAVLAQCVRPGAPVIYGAVTSNVDMKSGSPMFGTPEQARGLIASGQLARRYGLPFRPGVYNASNALDAQAIYETQNSLWSSVLAHGNAIFHALGWLEGGLTCSFEKMIIDAEMLQQLSEFLIPIDLSKDSLGFSAIAEVGPGGISLVPPTHWNATSTPSTSLSFPTKKTMKLGLKVAVLQQMSAQPKSGSRCCPSTSRPSLILRLRMQSVYIQSGERWKLWGR